MRGAHCSWFTLALTLALLLGALHSPCAAPKASDGGKVNCQSLSETLDHPRWLCLPMSRLVVNPTYSYSQVPPQTPFIGGAFSTDMAYYVGAEPARLPGFLAWQSVGGDPAVVFGQNLDLTATEWQPKGVTADFTGGQARLSPTGPYGSLDRAVTVDLDRTPDLLIQIPRCTGGWALKANDGGEAVDIALVADTSMAGGTTADVRAATGWHGVKTFTLKLFATGGPAKTLTCSRLQFVALPPASAPAAHRFVWEPHRIASPLTFGGGSIQAESTTALPDAQTFAQRLHIVRAGSGRLRLMGRFADGTVRWDAAHHALLLQAASYHVVLTLSRPARWLGVRPSALDWRMGQGTPSAPSASGVWALELGGLRAGEEIVAAARFAPGGVEAIRAGTQTQASPAAFAASLRRSEAAWNRRLASVPRPLDFTPRSVDAKGVTAADVRRSYGRAWVFFFADTLPPMPENGFPYPQVCAGKPSLWTGGAPHSEETAAWDSVVAMQALALTEPDTSWKAALGILSQVGPDGYLAGEALPGGFAQTFWLLGRQTGGLAPLRRVYPAWKRYMVWKIAHPRWINPNKSRADVKPSTQKDNEYVVHEIVDMGYAVKIASALGMPREAAFWQGQRRQAVADYLRWFLPSPGDVVYRIYASETDRGGPDLVWGVKGLQFASDLLPPSARDTLLTVFRRNFSLDRPFGISQNRFGDIEPITLGLFGSGQVSYARQMADLALRDVTRAGDFSEDYTQGAPPIPDGVRPSSFGARLMTDSVFWHNGVVLDEGFPLLLGMPGAAGVDNIPVQGSPISVRFGQTAHTVTLQGPGLARLRLPSGFRASVSNGEARWTGRIAEGQEIRLEGKFIKFAVPGRNFPSGW